jgi:transcriptional regulator with XRE-family HTH domain
MTFAEKLKELRTEKSLSREELASMSGLARATIRDYEQGRRQPLWDVLFKLCNALGVSCEAFAPCAGSTKAPPKSPRGRPPKSSPSTPPAEDLEATAKKARRRPRKEK